MSKEKRIGPQYWLSDEEMDAIERRPIVTKDALFGPMETWYKEHGALLAERYAGMHLMLNAKDGTYALGHSHRLAGWVYNAVYGPVPPGSYRCMLCIQFKPR